MIAPGPYIVGWSTLSPLGVGRQDFIDGLLSGRTGRRAAPFDGRGGPAVGYPTECDPAQLVGGKGTRTLDRMTLMVIATARMVLDEHAGTLGDRQGATGLVLGTSTGSIASITDFTRDTFVRDRPYHVDPAAFPNTVINGPAGRTAVWHGLRGLNSTVSAGRVTGLSALRYASRMIRRGYAETLLVGAVEEYSTPMAWAASRLPEATTPLGEGCVVFLVDSAGAVAEHGRVPVAELVDFEFAIADLDAAADQGELLAASIRTLLCRNGLRPGDLWLVSMAQAGGHDLAAAERAAVDAALAGAQGPRPVVAADQVGDALSVLGGFQLAAVLAMSGPGANGLNRASLITALGSDGAVACALVHT